MQEKDKGPAVRIPPPLIVVSFIGLAIWLNHLFPLRLLSVEWWYYGGIFLCIAATLIAGGTAIQFFKAKTNIEPWKPDSKLILAGFYNYSRNPIYLAFVVFTLGLGLVLGNVWVIVSTIPSVITLTYIVIKKEEKYLSAKFGREYIDYCQKVRRWL